MRTMSQCLGHFQAGVSWTVFADKDLYSHATSTSRVSADSSKHILRTYLEQGRFSTDRTSGQAAQTNVLDKAVIDADLV